MVAYMRSHGFADPLRFVRNWCGLDVAELGELTDEQARTVLTQAKQYQRRIAPTLK